MASKQLRPSSIFQWTPRGRRWRSATPRASSSTATSASGSTRPQTATQASRQGCNSVGMSVSPFGGPWSLHEQSSSFKFRLECFNPIISVNLRFSQLTVYGWIWVKFGIPFTAPKIKRRANFQPNLSTDSCENVHSTGLLRFKITNLNLKDERCT